MWIYLPIAGMRVSIFRLPVPENLVGILSETGNVGGKQAFDLRWRPDKHCSVIAGGGR